MGGPTDSSRRDGLSRIDRWDAVVFSGSHPEHTLVLAKELGLLEGHGCFGRSRNFGGLIGCETAVALVGSRRVCYLDAGSCLARLARGRTCGGDAAAPEGDG